jgi:phage tail-like protein
MPTSLDLQQAMSPALLGGAVSLAAQPASPGQRVSYGLTMRFSVAVDGLNLGDWSACKGLRVDFRTTQMTQGGDYQRAAGYLPERVEYTRVTLERAMTGKDSLTVKNWLRQVEGQWMAPTRQGGDLLPKNVSITLLDVSNAAVMQWVLTEAAPVSWSCTPFSTASNAVVLETLEFQHGGFL